MRIGDILGERIKEERKNKEWTVERLAEEASIAVGTVYNLERGDVNSRIETVESIANALDIPIYTLLGPATLAKTFSGVIHDPDEMLKHEKRVFEWEKNGKIRRVILPFFSVIHQTKEVALYIRKRGCYNYSPIEKEFTTKEIECFEETIEKRKRLVETPGHISLEIASEYEITKFARGEFEFKELNNKERYKQLDNIIKIVNEQIIPGVQIRVSKLPLYIMLALFGEEQVTIRGRGIYLDVSDKNISQSFLNNFTELWRKSLHGKDLLDFLKKQRDSISK